MPSVEVMDCFLADFDQLSRTAMIHFCVWSELLDSHVITVVQYSPKLGLRLVHSSGVPEADYWVVNSEECLKDAKELADVQAYENRGLN